MTTIHDDGPIITHDGNHIRYTWPKKECTMTDTTNPQFLDLIEDTAPTDDRDRFGYYLDTDDHANKRVRPGIWFLVADGGHHQCAGGNVWHIPAGRAVNHGPVWALVKESPLTGETGE